MSKVFQPEHVVTDNPHGGMVYGPVSDENNDDGTRYLQTVKGGHTIIVNQNGNKLDKKYKNKPTISFSPTTSYNQNQVDNLAGGRYVNSQNYEQYDVAIIKLYNRVLTQDEVQRNFTAHRGRFSI